MAVGQELARVLRVGAQWSWSPDRCRRPGSPATRPRTRCDTVSPGVGSTSGCVRRKIRLSWPYRSRIGSSAASGTRIGSACVYSACRCRTQPSSMNWIHAIASWFRKGARTARPCLPSGRASRTLGRSGSSERSRRTSFIGVWPCHDTRDPAAPSRGSSVVHDPSAVGNRSANHGFACPSACLSTNVPGASVDCSVLAFIQLRMPPIFRSLRRSPGLSAGHSTQAWGIPWRVSHHSSSDMKGVAIAPRTSRASSRRRIARFRRGNGWMSWGSRRNPAGGAVSRSGSKGVVGIGDSASRMVVFCWARRRSSTHSGCVGSAATASVRVAAAAS